MLKIGDKDALANLLLNLSPSMLQKAKVKFHLNTEDAEDAIQNAIILIQKNIKNLQNIHHFDSWVFTIVHNECLKILNSRKKNSSIVVFLKRELAHYDLSSEPTDYSDFEDNSAFAKLISPLDSTSQVILKLYYQHHFTSKEIASNMNMPENTVKSKLKRSREKLEKYVRKEEESDETAH